MWNRNVWRKQSQSCAKWLPSEAFWKCLQVRRRKWLSQMAAAWEAFLQGQRVWRNSALFCFHLGSWQGREENKIRALTEEKQNREEVCTTTEKPGDCSPDAAHAQGSLSLGEDALMALGLVKEPRVAWKLSSVCNDGPRACLWLGLLSMMLGGGMRLDHITGSGNWSCKIALMPVWWSIDRLGLSGHFQKPVLCFSLKIDSYIFKK